MNDPKEKALFYHRKSPAGKLEIRPTKPCKTPEDLSLAYTPGVAEPCLRIAKRPEDARLYTIRGNSVAVATNGTAVLGLGNIGALAAKPVMEGKAVLFKRFADIDAVDIEIDSEDPEDVIRTVKLLEPTFGGINLEDIRAPECFLIEETLKRNMGIPVFHDDQHGTAVIVAAALINALELAGKAVQNVRVAFSGAGAAGIATARMLVSIGVDPKKLILSDKFGVVYRGRSEGMHPLLESFAADTACRTLPEIMDGADVFIGVSAGGIVSRDMIRRMNPRPVVFALANPIPEIGYHDTLAAVPDALVATGRSDLPNQVNNVLAFPGIFRGALDVEALIINEAMKRAAALAIAELARKAVPRSVRSIYGGGPLKFGPRCILPKPLDPRVVWTVAAAVANAAMESGVARRPVADMEKYIRTLKTRLSGRAKGRP